MTYFLSHTTSDIALLTSLVIVPADTGDVNRVHLSRQERWVHASLLMLIDWVLRILAGRETLRFSEDGKEQPFPETYNRHDRRLEARCRSHAFPIVRRLSPLRRLVRGRFTPTQWMETRVKFSVCGRIDIYRIIFFAHRLVRERLWALFGFRHDYVISTPTLRRGLSHAQLPPD